MLMFHSLLNLLLIFTGRSRDHGTLSSVALSGVKLWVITSMSTSSAKLLTAYQNKSPHSSESHRTLPFVKSKKKWSSRKHSSKGSKKKKSKNECSSSGKSSKSRQLSCHHVMKPITNVPLVTNMPSSTMSTNAPTTNAPTQSRIPSSSPSMQASITMAPTQYNCASPVGRLQDINNVVTEISGTIPTVEGSPEYQAYDWLMNTDNTFGCDNGIVSLRQRYILAVFYYMTNGDTWNRNDGWLQPGASECTWFGVICDPNEKVISLELDSNQISGSLPTELGALSSLCEIHFYQNAITGNLPTQLGKLTCLTVLDIEANSFDGPLFFPELFSASKTIQYLRGSQNRFTGSIPKEIGLLSGLKELWATDNFLTGSIPSELISLQNLTSIYLYENKLSGTIPTEIGDMNGISALDISTNNISGTIPSSIGNFKKLRRLGLRGMELSGTIPSSLGRISTLETMLLDRNRLSGQIPSVVGSLPSLDYVLLNNNQLTGTIPSFTSEKLNYLDVSQNFLNGTIPSVIFTLPRIYFAYFSNNTFGGSIPSNYGFSISLNDLWLDGNRLSGSIPVVPSNGLSNMTQLLLNNNRLIGNVPDSICAVRTAKPLQFRVLHADCAPRSGISGQAQNNCAVGCCTACFVGPLAP